MPSLDDRQAAIAQAVTKGLTGQTAANLVGGTDPRQRLAIHARHYERSLTAALAAKFPATARLIGAAAFLVATRTYVRDHPPRRPCIAEYGDDFPAFLGRNPKLRGLPYVQTFSELEWAVGQASIAVAHSALDWAHVARIEPEALIGCSISMQPGVGYLRAQWRVDALLKACIGSSASEPSAPEPGEVCIEIRGARVHFELRTLEPATHVFRRALRAGQSIGAAAELALDSDADFDAGIALRGVVDAGLACALHTTAKGGRR